MSQQQAPETTHGAVRAVINANASDAESRLLQLENAVVVKQLSDLPTPIANEILLTSSNYHWVGTIDLSGNTLVIDGANVRICGQGAHSSIIFEDAVNPIDLRSGSLSLENVTISGGVVITHKAILVGSASTLIMESCVVSAFLCAVDITTPNIVSINRTQFIGNDKGVKISGSSATAKISIFLCDFTNYVTQGILLDVASKVSQFLISSTGFSSGVGATAITGDAASVNIDLRAVINGCTFNGDGSPLAGIDEKDIKFEFIGCFGVFDSSDYGYIDFINPSVNPTTILDGTWTPLTAVGGSWNVEPESSRFVEDTDGILKFVGENKTLGECEFEISSQTGTGTTNNYELGVSVDGAAPVALSILPLTILNTGRIAAWAFPSNIDVTDKTWELQVRGVGTTTPVTFNTARLRVKRV